jgi:Cu2+-exporting ATPase
VHALRARGVRALVTSGDRPEATALTAHQLRVPGSGGLGPAEKALAIRALQLAGARVLLVSDGWNDPRVAAQADLAIAVAPGALPGAVGAPIVVCRDRLDELPGLVDLGRALRAVIRQNTALAAAYNAALIPAAALGYVSPLAAAGLALAETLLGLANAARLLRGPAISPRT